MTSSGSTCGVRSGVFRARPVDSRPTGSHWTAVVVRQKEARCISHLVVEFRVERTLRSAAIPIPPSFNLSPLFVQNECRWPKVDGKRSRGGGRYRRVENVFVAASDRERWRTRITNESSCWLVQQPRSFFFFHSFFLPSSSKCIHSTPIFFTLSSARRRRTRLVSHQLHRAAHSSFHLPLLSPPLFIFPALFISPPTSPLSPLNGT